MFDDYKQQILKHFDEALAHEMNSSPNYLTMVMIKDHLVEKGMHPHKAEHISTSIQIMVSDDIFRDAEFMSTVTEKFAEVVFRIYNFSKETFETDRAFANLIDGMSLTLIPPQE